MISSTLFGQDLSREDVGDSSQTGHHPHPNIAHLTCPKLRRRGSIGSLMYFTEKRTSASPSVKTPWHTLVPCLLLGRKQACFTFFLNDEFLFLISYPVQKQNRHITDMTINNEVHSKQKKKKTPPPPPTTTGDPSFNSYTDRPPIVWK